jgi:hypothetical protein
MHEPEASWLCRELTTVENEVAIRLAEQKEYLTTRSSEANLAGWQVVSTVSSDIGTFIAS